MPRGHTHPLRDEFRAMGYEGVVKKYGSAGKAAKAIGVTLQTVTSWVPTGRKAPPRFRGFDKEYPDLPIGAARILRIFKRLLVETGRSPPLRDVMQAAGFSSANAIVCFVRTLERHGYVTRPLGRYKSCGIQLTDKAGATPHIPHRAIRYLVGFCSLQGGNVAECAKEVREWLEKTLSNTERVEASTASPKE